METVHGGVRRSGGVSRASFCRDNCEINSRITQLRFQSNLPGMCFLMPLIGGQTGSHDVETVGCSAGAPPASRRR